MRRHAHQANSIPASNAWIYGARTQTSNALTTAPTGAGQASARAGMRMRSLAISGSGNILLSLTDKSCYGACNDEREFPAICGALRQRCTQLGLTFVASRSKPGIATTWGRSGQMNYSHRAGCLPLTWNGAEVTSVLARFSGASVGALKRRVSTSHIQPLITVSLGMSG